MAKMEPSASIGEPIGALVLADNGNLRNFASG